MALQLTPPRTWDLVYPDSDGKPMAENTLQFQWITTLQGGVDALLRHDPDVFVAGDLLWYPVEGHPEICAAPDTMVAFGRPKGYRGSYKQWEEDGIAPQVDFEVLSPNNTVGEMVRKHEFYEKYGVEECYVYDPERVRLEGWIREEGRLREIAEISGWVSPRLQIRFEVAPEGLRVFGPDNRPFATYVELVEQREAEQGRAEAEHERAEQERLRAEAERERAERLAARLRELGVESEP